MRKNMITVLLGIAMVGCLISPGQAQLYTSGYPGNASTLDRDVQIRQPSVRNDLGIEDASFESPTHYGFGGGYLLTAMIRESLGLEVEFLHAKAVADTAGMFDASGANARIPIEKDLLLNDIAQRFNISHGISFLVFNVVGRLGYWKGQQFPYGRIQPYAGAGLGAVVINPENDVGGYPVEHYGRDWPAVQAFIGTQVFLFKHLAFFSEYKFTHASGLLLDMYQGEGDTALNSHHIISGLALHF